MSNNIKNGLRLFVGLTIVVIALVITTFYVTAPKSTQSLKSIDEVNLTEAGGDQNPVSVHPIPAQFSSNYETEDDLLRRMGNACAHLSGKLLEEQLAMIANELDTSDFDQFLLFWAELPVGNVSNSAFSISIQRIGKASPWKVLERYDEAKNILNADYAFGLVYPMMQYIVRQGDELEAFERLSDPQRNVLLNDQDWNVAMRVLFRKWSDLRAPDAYGAVFGISNVAVRDNIIVNEMENLDEFLEAAPESGPRLFGAITEEANKQKFLEKLSLTYAMTSPEKAIVSLSQALPEVYQEPFREGLFINWLEHDPNTALKWLTLEFDSLKVGERDAWLSGSIRIIAKEDPASADAWARLIHDQATRDRALLKIANH